MNAVNNSAKNELIRSVKCIQRNDRHSLHAELKYLIGETTRYNLRNKAITPKFRTNVYIIRIALFIVLLFIYEMVIWIIYGK